MNLYQHAKNQLDSSIHSSDMANFTILSPKVPSHLTPPTQKLLKYFLAFMNLYQHEKNQLNSSIHSPDIADFRVS